MLIALTLSALAAEAPHAHDHVDADALTADEVAAHGCATMALFARNGRPEKKELPKPEGAFMDLQDRDTFGMPKVRYSEHFAFRWGNRRGVEVAEIDNVLQALERAYVVQIEGMGHRLPEEMEGYYYNVYLADSHTSAPRDSETAAAYVTSDREGQSYIAFMQNSMRGDEEQLQAAASTAAHEFYHVVQFETARYDYVDRDGWSPGAWFWEATANWAAGVVYPGQADYARNLPVYAFNPHRRADYFRNLSEGGYESGYQYGAFIWPLHASQTAKTFEVVADVWKDEGDVEEPLEVMRAKLADQGLDMNEVWLDHIARNATWDYPDRSIYLDHIQDAQGQPAAINQVAMELDRDGQDWKAPSEGLVPQRYGYNTLTISRPNAGKYTIELEGEAQSSIGEPAFYGATLVLEPYEGDVEYRRIPFDGPKGTLVAEDLGEVFKAYIVIGAWSDATSDISEDESFPYQVKLGYEGDGNGSGNDTGFEGEAPRPPQPSACQTGALPTGLAGLGIAALVGLLRRRRDR